VIRLAVRVRRAQAELVLAELLELASAGVEEVADGDSVEFALYGAPGELPSLPALQAAAGEALVHVATREIPDDWHERWKRFHRPVAVQPPPARPGAEPLPALVVRPPWEGAGAQPGVAAERDTAATAEVQEIVIDPGRAFGTGAHATTRQCLALLLELAALQRGRPAVVDLGTGSGVLAIAAARLGFAPVRAVDNDRESVAAAAANAAANDVAVEVRRGDLRDTALLREVMCDAAPAAEPVVIANLLLPLLCELAAAIPLAPAHLIAGGMLPAQVDQVAGAFASRLGLRERRRVGNEGWAAVWLARSQP
jgi:ribosomal protein L11 methyltransferase